jgi:hypothetical protein
MRPMAVFFLVIIITTQIFPAKIGTLTGVLKPEKIKVFEDELFVVEGATFFIYSLKDLSLKRKFSGPGEGPGELKVVPNFSNDILVFPHRIQLESIDKIVYFSRDGKFLKQQKKLLRSNRITPLGKNFVGKKRIEGLDKKTYSTINIYDSNFKKIKELFRQKYSRQGNNLELVVDSLNFWIYDDKIFVEESPQGFFIEVFDSEGKKLYDIKKKYEKINVTADHRTKIINTLKNERVVKILGWENIKNLYKFNFFDSFPAIQDIAVDEGRIYVQTFRKKGNKEEFIIMDLKGNILKKKYLCPGKKPEILVRMFGLGPKFYSIDKNKFYYLEEDEEDEKWVLYVTHL